MKCHIQYVDSTATEFMLTDKKSCEVAAHFYSDIEFIGIGRIVHRNTDRSLESILLT